MPCTPRLTRPTPPPLSTPQARLSLRQLKEVQRARLRQYYYDALRGSATALAAGAGGSAAGSNAVAAAAAAADMPDAAAAAAAVGAHDGSARVVEEDGLLDPETVQRTLGPNGLFRVSYYSSCTPPCCCWRCPCVFGTALARPCSSAGPGWGAGEGCAGAAAGTVGRARQAGEAARGAEWWEQKVGI